MISTRGTLYLSRDCFRSAAQWRESNDKFLADLEAKRVKPEDYSIARQFIECFGEAAYANLCTRGGGGFVVGESPWQETGVPASAFPIITGQVISTKVIEAYTLNAAQALSLVEVVPSSRKTERVPGFTALEGLNEVPENREYDFSGIGEKYVTIDNTKYGRIIGVTEEAVREDQTGQLLSRAGRFGEFAAYKQRRLILEGVIDLNSTVYKPSGTASALYTTARTGQTNATTTASAGTINSTNLDGALGRLYTMKDESGNYINAQGVPGLVLMCAPAVMATAQVYLNSSVLPGASNDTINPYRGIAELVVNPFESASTTWQVGWFRRQFVWTEYFPLQVFQAQQNDYEFQFKRDILAAYKVRFAGGIGATDYVFVQQMTA